MVLEPGCEVAREPFWKVLFCLLPDGQPPPSDSQAGGQDVLPGPFINLFCILAPLFRLHFSNAPPPVRF